MSEDYGHLHYVEKSYGFSHSNDNFAYFCTNRREFRLSASYKN